MSSIGHKAQPSKQIQRTLNKRKTNNKQTKQNVVNRHKGPNFIFIVAAVLNKNVKTVKRFERKRKCQNQNIVRMEIKNKVLNCFHCQRSQFGQSAVLEMNLNLNCPQSATFLS
jgi:hypothetical protein